MLDVCSKIIAKTSERLQLRRSCSGVSVVDFEQVNVDGVADMLQKNNIDIEIIYHKIPGILRHYMRILILGVSDLIILSFFFFEKKKKKKSEARNCEEINQVNLILYRDNFCKICSQVSNGRNLNCFKVIH